MTKAILLLLAMSHFTLVHAQSGYIVLKKKHKTLQYFWKDGRFTFQTKSGQWITGIITGTGNDSFYLAQEIIRYFPIGADTFHVSGLKFSLKDVYAIPAKKEIVVHDNDEVRVILGHEKFVWIRNGFIFKVAGAGYAGLNIINALIQKIPPFSRNNLTVIGIGSAVFLTGIMLHMKFDPYIHPGKKYRLEMVTISPAK